MSAFFPVLENVYANECKRLGAVVANTIVVVDAGAHEATTDG